MKKFPPPPGITYPGVDLLSPGRWRARITKNHNTFNLGTFDTAEGAAYAYNKA